MLDYPAGQPIDDEFLEYALQVKQEIQDKLAAVVSIGIGPACGKLADASRSCQGAASALNYGLVTGDGSILDSRYLDPADNQVSIISIAAEMELYKYLRMGDTGKVAAFLSEIHADLRTANMDSLDRCRTVYLQILISTFRLADETLPDACRPRQAFAEYPSRLARKNSLAEMHEYVSDCVLSVCRTIAESHCSKYFKLIADARNFTRERYHEALSLQSVAEHVHMAASYFSYIFKKETGENWSGHLTRIRIEKAMELLKDPLIKTYEVAFLVGFNEPNYFSNQFKKIVGCSPSEYKASLGQVAKW